MIQRISVSISDELYDRLQVVKDSINVSGECQQAIERIVTMNEIAQKDLPKKEKALERLRAEKEQSEQYWFNEGKKEGADSATYFDYDYLATFANKFSTRELQAGDFVRNFDFPEDFCAEVLKLEANEGGDAFKEHIEQMQERNGCILVDEYAKGYVTALIEFYDEV